MTCHPSEGLVQTCRVPPGVYAGSTRLPFGVFGRQRSGADSLDLCGFARLGATSGDV